MNNAHSAHNAHNEVTWGSGGDILRGTEQRCFFIMFVKWPPGGRFLTMQHPPGGKQTDSAKHESKHGMKINHICLMPGHSTKDGGAVVCGGPEPGLSEYQLACRYLPEIARGLRARGYDVTITSREQAGGTTPSYSGRAALATGAQLAVEFHFNSAGASASGAECLYWYASSKGEYVAKVLAGSCAAVLGLRNRGAKPRFSNAVQARAHGYDASAARGAGMFETCWDSPQVCIPVMVEPCFAGSNEVDAVRLLRTVANGEFAAAMVDAIDMAAKGIENN